MAVTEPRAVMPQFAGGTGDTGDINPLWTDQDYARGTVTDKFRNTFTNQRGGRIATVGWQVINFERGHAAVRHAGGTAGPVLPHPWTEAVNQRGEVVLPGRGVIALHSRDAGPSPAARKARTS